MLTWIVQLRMFPRLKILLTPIPATGERPAESGAELSCDQVGSGTHGRGRGPRVAAAVGRAEPTLYALDSDVGISE